MTLYGAELHEIGPALSQAVVQDKAGESAHESSMTLRPGRAPVAATPESCRKDSISEQEVKNKTHQSLDKSKGKAMDALGPSRTSTIFSCRSSSTTCSVSTVDSITRCPESIRYYKDVTASRHGSTYASQTSLSHACITAGVLPLQNLSDSTTCADRLYDEPEVE